MKTNYITGPVISGNNVTQNSEFLSFVVPSPHAVAGDPVPTASNTFVATSTVTDSIAENLIQENRFSTFCRMKRSYAKVLEYVHKLKVRINTKDPSMLGNLTDEDRDFENEASMHIIKAAQMIAFPDIFKYFDTDAPVIEVPNLVRQLNIYKDKYGMLRVCSKFERFKKDSNICYFPLLLPRDSRITELVILDLHVKFFYAGLYALLNEISKRFYIPRYFSVTKKVLNTCIVCRKMNARTIKLSQSSYREFRVNPHNIPFSYGFLDYMGPFYTKQGSERVKVWILIITCMWS